LLDADLQNLTRAILAVAEECPRRDSELVRHKVKISFLSMRDSLESSGKGMLGFTKNASGNARSGERELTRYRRASI